MSVYLVRANWSAVAFASLTFLLSHVQSYCFISRRQAYGNLRDQTEEATMAKKLYVGNLAYSVTDSTLEQMFAAHGNVQSAQVIMDRDTGRSKGFGFVEMSSDQEAQAAIAAMNGQQVEGRSLTVNEARPREDRGGGGGRGGHGGGGYGRRDRY